MEFGGSGWRSWRSLSTRWTVLYNDMQGFESQWSDEVVWYRGWNEFKEDFLLAFDDCDTRISYLSI